MKDVKKLNDFTTYEENPWKPDGISRQMKYSDADERILTDSNTGEVFTLIPTIKVGGKFVRDRLEYRKLYVGTLDKIKKLSVPGLRLFCYILTDLPRCSDEVYIDPRKAREYCGYSSQTQFYAGLINLLENDIVVRKVGVHPQYFINVNVFFNGDRGKMLRNKEND